MPKTLILIDGHALAYRAYYALTRGSDTSRWRTNNGEPTAGIYGFTSVLLRILAEENPDYLAVAFDTGRTFRDEMFEEYKATREKMPEDLVPQIERMRQLVDTFNIPRLEQEGYEADDVLGSTAVNAVEHGLGVKIFTGDRDLLQLVDKRIIVNLPSRSLSDARDYLPDDVKEYLGVWPRQVVDYKALVGDTSDNIPGVRGIGQKTAQSLLETYDTLDEIYKHLDELPKGTRKRLEEGKENAYLSQKLARIVTDLQVKIDLEKARPERFDPEHVEELFRELEFRSLMRPLKDLEKRYGVHIDEPRPGEQLTLFGEAAADIRTEDVETSSPTRFDIVDTPEKLNELVERLSAADQIAFDTETTSTDQMQAELVGISIAIQEGEGFYIPVGHHDAQSAQLPIPVVLEALRAPFTDPAISKIGHNLKYDFVMLARYGLRSSPLKFDTMIAEWLVNPTSRNLGLKNLAWVRLGVQMTEIEKLIGKGRSQITIAEVPVAKAAAYAAADADMTLRLVPLLQAELEQSNALKVFDEIEMPLVAVLSEMEMNGVRLDTDFLSSMSVELNTRLGQIATQIYQAVGEEFNLNSTQQLSTALFDRLGLEPPDRTRKTSSGFYSTAADVLEAMRREHEVVEWVLEYRELAKLKSTYVDALPQQVNPATGRVHTSYNQTGSVTGRIASSDPNLQNIPIRTELGREVRKAFVADDGAVLLAVDYSQVELRIAAHMSEDEGMIAAFRAGQDIHAATAAAIYNQEISAVTQEQRRHAKAINFGLLYGMSPFGLTRATDLTLAEAEDFVATYFERFPGILNYIEQTKKFANEHGYVETLLGRRRYFPGLKTASNFNVRSREEREAINAPIQGTAADIMKIAMLKVPEAIGKAKLAARVLLQVHDELVLECPQAELVQTAQIVMDEMRHAYELVVPLLTEARYGTSWGELKSVQFE
jgi:DNA polymerase-1